MAENSNGYSYTIEYVQQQKIQMKRKETNKQENKTKQAAFYYVYLHI